MSAQTHWLLDVEIGRTYRWSEVAVNVTRADGTVLMYGPGLADPGALAQGDAPQVSVLDPSVPWPTLAPQLDGRGCTLRRWIEGTRWEQAEIYAGGEATGVEYGAQDEAVSWSIEAVAGAASLGQQVPDPLAAVNTATWPVGGSTYTIGESAPYPVIFGYPGWIEETGGRSPCIPIPLGQFKTATPATTYAIVSEDPEAPITSVEVRNEDLVAEGTETVVPLRDLLGRTVLACHFSLSVGPRPTSEGQRLWAAYTPTGGGGVARTAYDVVVYMLRRWGPATVDWVRLAEVRDLLSQYRVDGCVDEPVSDPWAWIESTIIADLPFEIRGPANAKYIVAKRYVSDPTRRIGSLVAGVDCARVSAVSREDTPVNEFVGLYRLGRNGDWLGRVTLTGASVLSAPRVAAAPAYSTAQLVFSVRSGSCQQSVARYGLRQAPQREYGWTWDTGTVIRALEAEAERWALPALLVSYELQSSAALAERLVEGDEVLLTDAELNWSAVPAIVDAPPVRGTTTTALLRVLA